MQEKTEDKKIKIDYLLILFSPLKYKIFIVIFNFIGFIIATGIIALSLFLPSEKSFLPNKYVSDAKIIIPYRENNRNDINSLADIANAGLTIERDIKKNEVIISILKTNTVLDGVINDCFLPEKNEYKEKLDKKLITRESIRNIVLNNTTFKKNDLSGFLTIGYEDIDPVFAKKMVDTYLNKLNKITLEFALTQTTLKKRFIQERLNDLFGKLSKAKSDFIDFQQEYGIISPENEAQQITNTVASLRSQLINAEADLENYRRIHKLSQDEKTDLDFEVENLRKKILKYTKSSSDESENRLIISKDTISELTSKYQNLKKNVEDLENINSQLMKELELAQIQEKSEGSFFQVIDQPEIPTKKSSPARFRMLIQDCLIIFIISLALVMMKEFIKELKRNPEYIKRAEILKSYIKNNRKK